MASVSLVVLLAVGLLIGGVTVWMSIKGPPPPR